jgi:hypothetical protein
MSKIAFSASPWLLLGAIAFVGASCSSMRTGSGALRKDSPEYVANRLQDHRTEATWFEAKARVDYDDGQQALRGNATIRMRKDSSVWVALRKLGFEVARVLITPDSAFVIDRFNNVFSAYQLDDLAGKYRLPARLDLLQDIVLGNPLLLPADKRHVETIPGGLWLEEGSSGHTVRHRLREGNYLPEAIEYRDLQAAIQVKLTLGEYAAVGRKDNFSYLRTLTLEDQQSGKINLEIKFSEVVLNVPKDMPFEIPERYLRVQ